VGDSVEGIIRQTYERLDIVVIDNGSTDGSSEVVRTFRDKRITLLSQPSGYLVSALNRGLRHARGTLVARQDADDHSEPERIFRQVSLLQRLEEVEIVGCSYRTMDLAGVTLSTKPACVEPKEIRQRLLSSMPFAGASIVGSRSLFDTLHGYDSAFDGRVGEDYDLLVRAAEVTNISAVDESLYAYRMGNANSMCGLINYEYGAAKELVRLRALARGSRLFMQGH
jgi:glycosyltransferase involved in cell wall biosynthesis